MSTRKAVRDRMNSQPLPPKAREKRPGDEVEWTATGVSRAFHKLLEIFQKVSRNFSKSCFKVAQKPIKNSRKGKLNEKKFHARQLILKKYSCYGLKKIHTRNLQPRPQGFSLKKWVGLGRRLKEFDHDKKFLQLENSPLPHNFSNRPSLRFELLSTLWRSTFKICAV